MPKSVNAEIISGWETESAVARTRSDTKWPPYYAYPYISYNLRGDGKTILISGQEAYGGYFGYYWDAINAQWVSDPSLVSGLTSHGWWEAPALAFNVIGDNKWTLIGHATTIGNPRISSFYGYYWDGIKWVEDPSRIVGLAADGETSHVFIDNLKGDGKWTLASGNIDGTIKAFYWDAGRWVEDASRTAGLGDIGTQTKLTAAFNVYGDNKWNLIAASASSGVLRNFYWNGVSWIEDSAKAAGLDTGNMTELAPALGYNLRGDNKWFLVSGLTTSYKLLGFFYNSIDFSLLPKIQDISGTSVLATTIKINCTFPYSWNYDIKYSENSDMSGALLANTKYRNGFNDISGSLEFKIIHLKPNTKYYYQIYAYAPWNYSYYAVSSVYTFITLPSNNYITVNPGQSIQNAIETLPLEGGTVELAAGTHKIISPIRLQNDNIVFKGRGISQTLIEGGGIYASRYDDSDAIEAWNYAHGIKEKTFHDYSNSNPIDFIKNIFIKDLTIHNPDKNGGVDVAQGWNISVDGVKIYKDVMLNGSNGVHFRYTRDSVVKNSEINNFARGIWYWGPEKNDIINNTITNTWEALEYNGGWTFSESMLVKDNIITNTTADGMFIYSIVKASSTVPIINVSGNTVTFSGKATSQAGIALVLANFINVEKNVIKNSKNGVIVRTKNNYVPPKINLGGHTISNNLIYNNSERGIFFDDAYKIPFSQQNFVYSNTIFGNIQDGIDNSQGHNITLKNNIIASNTRYGINGINTQNTYNDVYNNTLVNYYNASSGIGDISINPLFVDSANNDFHLQPNSSLLTAGENGTYIGAYSSVINSNPIIPPFSFSSDLNSDNKVNSLDLGILMSAWGNITKPASDINQDGIVNSIDFGIIMSQWG